jgi:hypothetical protein
VERRVAKTEAALEEAQADKTEKSRAVAEFTAAFAATGDERKAALAAAAKARKAEDEAKRALGETQRNREEVRRKAARTTTALETARETQQRETQADTRAADAVIAQATKKLESAQAAAERARAEERAAADAAAAARSARDAGAQDKDDSERAERDARDAVARLQGAQRDGLSVFGNNMPALVRGACPEFRAAPTPHALHHLSDAAMCCRLCPPRLRVRSLACALQQRCRPTGSGSARRPWAPWARCCACLTQSGPLRWRRRSATCCPRSWWPTPRTGGCCSSWPRRWACRGRLQSR